MSQPAKRNPVEEMADETDAAFQSIIDEIARMAGEVEPAFHEKLDLREEDIAYDHPASQFPGEVDEMTGLPLTNAQAAQRLLQEMGEIDYVRWVDDVERRRERRAR